MIELRRSLIGDTYGDYNMCLYPDATYTVYWTDNITTYKGAAWYHLDTPGQFGGSRNAFHLRRLWFTTGGTTTTSTIAHIAPTSTLPAVARFSVGFAATEITPNTFFGFGAGGPEQTIQPQAFGYYEIKLTSQPAAPFWHASMNIPPPGGTIVLDELRVWEYLDISRFLEEMIPSESSAEIFQFPFGKFFVGTHSRITNKRLTISLLFPRGESLFRQQLESILYPQGPTGAEYPLELFADGYLQRCAVSSLRYEHLSGAVSRAIIELTMLKPFAYHQNRAMRITSAPSQYLELNEHNPGTVPVPCEVRVSFRQSDRPQRVRVTILPSSSFCEFETISDFPTTHIPIYSIQGNGQLLLGFPGSPWGGTLQPLSNVSYLLLPTSRLPMILHPRHNRIIVELITSTTPADPVSVSVSYNPAVAELVQL